MMQDEKEVMHIDPEAGPGDLPPHVEEAVKIQIEEGESNG